MRRKIISGVGSLLLALILLYLGAVLQSGHEATNKNAIEFLGSVTSMEFSFDQLRLALTVIALAFSIAGFWQLWLVRRAWSAAPSLAPPAASPTGRTADPILTFHWQPGEPYSYRERGALPGGFRVGIYNTGGEPARNVKAELWSIVPSNRIPSGTLPRLLRWKDNALTAHINPGPLGERVLEIFEGVRGDGGLKIRFLTDPPIEFQPDFGLDYRGVVRLLSDNASHEGAFTFRVRGPNMVYPVFQWDVPPPADLKA